MHPSTNPPLQNCAILGAAKRNRAVLSHRDTGHRKLVATQKHRRRHRWFGVLLRTGAEARSDRLVDYAPPAVLLFLQLESNRIAIVVCANGSPPQPESRVSHFKPNRRTDPQIPQTPVCPIQPGRMQLE